MSFGARRHTAVRKSEVDTPTFNIQALLQGCVAARPEDSGDATPLIVDFPDRPAKMLAVRMIYMYVCVYINIHIHIYIYIYTL